jgi:hypothetical protein
LENEITNRNVIVVAACCHATSQNGIMASAINGKYLIGMSKSINSAEALSVLFYGIEIFNNNGQINDEIKAAYPNIDILK